MHRKLINVLMKWLENTVKNCVLLTILRLESFVGTSVRDLVFAKILRTAQWIFLKH